jgi:hypothetical protein
METTKEEKIVIVIISLILASLLYFFETNDSSISNQRLGYSALSILAHIIRLVGIFAIVNYIYKLLKGRPLI